MINAMIADLQQQGADDAKHKEWCTKELDHTEQMEKETQTVVDTHAQKIAEKNTELGSIQDQLKEVKQEVEDLKLADMVATAQRKKEKELFTKTQSELTISQELVKKARDKLASFYTPKAAALNQVETMFRSSQPDFQGLSFAQLDSDVAAPYEKKTGAA